MEKLLSENQEKTVVSVIIPLYNGRKYICDTVKHVLKMKSAKEIIIVDDGSTDGGYDYCVQIFAKETDVHVLYKENGGIASARNYGLRNAAGNLILFVDQDDTVVVETIDLAVRILSENDYDFVCWSTEKKVSKQRPESLALNRIETEIERKEILEDLFPSLLHLKESKITTSIGSVWAMLYRHSVIEENQLQFKCFVSYEDDYLFVLDYLSCANRGYFLKEPGYCWTVNSESYSHQRRYIDQLFEKIEAFNQYCLDCLHQIKAPKEIADDFDIFAKQREIIWLISNSFERWNFKIRDAYQIRSIFTKVEYRAAFQMKRMVGGRYNRIMYALLKRNFVGIAMAATWLVFIKATIQNKIMDMAHQNAK